MKKIFCLAVAAVMSLSVAFSQNNQGVDFRKGTLKEILAQAAKEKKYVFMDVYTTWCGPCKHMANVVFPQKKVGDYFNKNFVNAKFDAEKGEGRDIASKYGVNRYPTFLILDSNGKEVGRLIGSDTPEGIIKRVQEAVANIGK